MADYTVRPANAEDTPRIVDLLKLCLGEGSVPRTAEFWDWKHRQNPFGESPVLLAEADGELIGVRAFMRWRWTDGEDVVESVRAVDTATHPEHRGKGIFTRLTLGLLESLRGEGAEFVFNTPNAQSTPGYLKMGWHVYGRVPVAVAVRRPTRVARYAWDRLRSGSREVTAPASDEWARLQSVSGFLRSADAAELLSDPARTGDGHALRTPADVLAHEIDPEHEDRAGSRVGHGNGRVGHCERVGDVDVRPRARAQDARNKGVSGVAVCDGAGAGVQRALGQAPGGHGRRRRP